MDRDAIARARRRREFEEALEEERGREEALRDQIEFVVAEEEGARIDHELLALLAPAEAALLADLFADPTDGEEDELEPEDDTDPEGDDEVARLLGEIEHSRARQRALERAAQLLGPPAGGAPGTQSE